MSIHPEDAASYAAQLSHDMQAMTAELAKIAAALACPACGAVRGVPDPTRYACPACWDALHEASA